MATDSTVPASTVAPPPPLTPGTSLATSRYVIVALLALALLAALGALEITKRARRAPEADDADADTGSPSLEPSLQPDVDHVELTIDA